MKKTIAALFAALLAAAPLIYAKGPTLKVVITGGNLSRPVEIVDAAALKDFNIWSGAGTSIGAPGSPGFVYHGIPETFIVANWSPVSAPAPALERYRVAFYANHHKDGLDYIVTYVEDPANHRGFVYLPGKGEPDYELNTFSILRGVEGQWFETRKSWMDLVARAKR